MSKFTLVLSIEEARVAYGCLIEANTKNYNVSLIKKLQAFLDSACEEVKENKQQCLHEQACADNNIVMSNN